jgi:hypothetical protein
MEAKKLECNLNIPFSEEQLYTTFTQIDFQVFCDALQTLPPKDFHMFLTMNAEILKFSHQRTHRIMQISDITNAINCNISEATAGKRVQSLINHQFLNFKKSTQKDSFNTRVYSLTHKVDPKNSKPFYQIPNHLIYKLLSLLDLDYLAFKLFFVIYNNLFLLKDKKGQKKKEFVATYFDLSNLLGQDRLKKLPPAFEKSLSEEDRKKIISRNRDRKKKILKTLRLLASKGLIKFNDNYVDIEFTKIGDENHKEYLRQNLLETKKFTIKRGGKWSTVLGRRRSQPQKKPPVDKENTPRNLKKNPSFKLEKREKIENRSKSEDQVAQSENVTISRKTPKKKGTNKHFDFNRLKISAFMKNSILKNANPTFGWTDETLEMNGREFSDYLESDFYLALIAVSPEEMINSPEKYFYYHAVNFGAFVGPRGYLEWKINQKKKKHEVENPASMKEILEIVSEHPGEEEKNKATTEEQNTFFKNLFSGFSENFGDEENQVIDSKKTVRDVSFKLL